MVTQTLEALAAAPIPTEVLEVVRALKARGHHAFLVGGCVRDILRGQKPKDWDVATDATPQQVTDGFKRVIPTGVEHGTVTVVLKGQHVEVTTFRAESEYVDGRRPSKVEFHGDIEADLSRRDFTINAMAYDPAEPRLVDPFDGEGDLARRLVRCVGRAEERFAEDGLRPLRAARFATVLDFTLDPATEAAIQPTVPVFKKVAAERVNQELVKLLESPRAPAGLDILARTGLLAAFFPEALGGDFAAVGRAPSLPVRLAVLLLAAPAPREVVLRLKFPNKVADTAAHLVAHRQPPPQATSDADLRRWLAKVGRAEALDVLALAGALGDDVGPLRRRLEALLAARPPLSTKELALDGKAIMAALGVGPSPVVGEASRYLLELVLDDPSRNAPEALAAALVARFPRR